MSRESKEWIRTVVGVIIVGILFFGAAALYDWFQGGESAREASVDGGKILTEIGIDQIQEDCVDTYTNADSASQALLIIAFGQLAANVQPNGDVHPDALANVIEATNSRVRYLRLLYRSSALCDPERENGPKPLPLEDRPPIPNLDLTSGG